MYGSGLIVQGPGLIAKPLSSTVNPDVGDLTFVPLRQVHVLLTHCLVEAGAD